MEADLFIKANHPPVTIYHFIKVPLFEFFSRVFVKKGFLDGTVGWLEGAIQAFNKFLVYGQIWEKQQKIFPIIGFILIWLIFSWKFFLKNYIPAPLDMLTNFYAPWQLYQVFPIKNPAIPDIVTQIMPWKIFTITQLKLGLIPLWNPFNFSGAPHLANFQSAVFSPANFLFFIPASLIGGFPFVNAWSLLILFQPLLAGIFTILYCRKIGLKKFSSFLSGLSFAFCGFLTVWLEYGTLGWAILWLPLTFLLWEYFWETKNGFIGY